MSCASAGNLLLRTVKAGKIFLIIFSLLAREKNVFAILIIFLYVAGDLSLCRDKLGYLFNFYRSSVDVAFFFDMNS